MQHVIFDFYVFEFTGARGYWTVRAAAALQRVSKRFGDG